MGGKRIRYWSHINDEPVDPPTIPLPPWIAWHPEADPPYYEFDEDVEDEYYKLLQLPHSEPN